MPFYALTPIIHFSVIIAEAIPVGVIGFFVMVAITVVLILLISKKSVDLHTHKISMIEGLQISSNAYYEALERHILEHSMPNIHIERVTHAEFHALSAKREYLRISRKGDIYDVCAAPFGADSFVSIWHGEQSKKLLKLAKQVPNLKDVVDGFEGATRYEIDTQAVFRVNIEESIKKTTDEMLEIKGTRISPEELARTEA